MLETTVINENLDEVINKLESAEKKQYCFRFDLLNVETGKYRYYY